MRKQYCIHEVCETNQMSKLSCTCWALFTPKGTAFSSPSYGSNPWKLSIMHVMCNSYCKIIQI